MARRSSGRSAPRPAARRAPPPAPVRQAPPPATATASSGGGMLGGLGATIAQGMAFGTGSAVAHRAVDSVMGPRTIQHEAVPAAAGSAAPELSKDACGMHLDAFTKCLNSSGSEISKCQFYMDMLNECKNNSMINA
ncbi:CHCH domain-containing protein [Heracleum sosnowskyi]|uniref:CHCH domain-containing protein n=1 Tax=Heracleum sosnowskyi TaxID=360622 RepID=A0AAD8MV57_9APIA|nr:CHCH domain-containing protein [Heracleum sosnowskyi]